MTDHFDPGANVVRLSDPVAKQNSVASMAVTAHELGHVQQYQTGSALIKARGVLLPALQFSPTVSYIAILLGLWFNMTGMLWLGIIFFALMVLFSILTLPIEIDASRRGTRLLQEAGLMQNENDASGSRAVLTAAALTYLAAAVTSILQLLYYISVAQRRS
jgi:Zn-dependent membrane protease YugP